MAGKWQQLSHALRIVLSCYNFIAAFKPFFCVTSAHATSRTELHHCTSKTQNLCWCEPLIGFQDKAL